MDMDVVNSNKVERKWYLKFWSYNEGVFAWCGACVLWDRRKIKEKKLIGILQANWSMAYNIGTIMLHKYYP